MQQHRLQFNKLADNPSQEQLVDIVAGETSHPLRQKRTTSQQPQHQQPQPMTLNHQLSMSSIASPSRPGGTFQGLASMDEDPLAREPASIGHPPQMIQQPEHIGYQSQEDERPYYHKLKQTQDAVSSIYPNFPMQANKDFFDNNYEQIIKKSATQIEFLFFRLQQKTMTSPLQKLLDQNSRGESGELVNSQNRQATAYFQTPAGSAQQQQQQQQPQPETNNYQKLVDENSHASQNIQMLRTSLTKAEDIVKNLRIENEYFQRQLDSLRKEVENAKNQQQNRARSLDRNSKGSQERGNAYFGAAPANVTNNGYEPQPLPQPRMNPPMPMMHEREDHSSPRRASSIKGQQNTSGMLRQNSRGSNPQMKRASAVSANNRRPQGGRRTLQTQDENTFAESFVAKDSNNAASLEQEVKTLRFELSQQSEVLLLKTDTVRNLQEQLDQQKRRLMTDSHKVQSELVQDCDALRKELELCKKDEVRKEAAILELRKECNELARSKTIEMNILMNKPMQSMQKQMSDEATAKGARSVKGATQSKALKNLQFAKDLNAEMELMFADDDFKIKQTKRTKKKDAKQAKQVQFNDTALTSQPQQIGPIQPNMLLQNQIQAAQLSESLIEEIQSMENAQTTEVSDLKNSCTSLEVHAKTLSEEKNYLSEKVTELSKTNDDLKRKFSALLDQFQEYVTIQESKQASDEEKQKLQQEQLLQNMQDNIKELEHVTESLQTELQNKETVFEVLKKENKELETKLTNQAAEENLHSQQAMRRLEDELGFLKRHHDLEINMLKEQYERSLETAKLIATETSKVQQTSTSQPSQSQLQQDLAARDNISAAGRSESIRLSDNQAYSQHHQAQSSTVYQGGADQHSNNNFYSGSVCLRAGSPHRQPSPPQRLNDARNDRAKEMLNSTHFTFEKLKKDLSEKEHLLEEKNREILRLRMANEEAMRLNLHKRAAHDHMAASQVDSEQRGQLVADLSYSIDSLRAELTRIKQNMFAQIGKHINFDAPTQFMGSSRQITREEDLHSEVIIQLSEIRALISLAQEISMLAQSSLTNRPHRDNSHSPARTNPSGNTTNAQQSIAKTGLDSNYQIKRNADQMLRQNHATGLHELILDQITRSETLMNDNALMQRQLYKYETTLAELDVILRGDKRDKSIHELKKLVEGQLKQIIVLQKEVELARQGQTSGLSISPTPPQQSFMNTMDNTSQKELEQIKYQLNEQRMANEELISERRNLMELIENLETQSKESHRNMEKALNKLMLLEKDMEEKNVELEDVRERVTKVAELFERKDIKQKYSFEVLCDFVHDKAKRLFVKYEAASKEKKVMHEEKNFYFQRKLDQLEQENFAMKETNRAAERIIHELVPNLATLLDRKQIQSNELSEYYYARSVLEQVEIEYRTLKKAHLILQERNNELTMQLDAYKTDASRMNPHAQSTIENCAPNSQQQSTYGNIITTGLNKSSALSNQSNNIYRHSAPRSPYDQKLSEARAQEQQEVLAAFQNGGGAGAQIISGHGSISKRDDNSVSPSRGHSPLRTGAMPNGNDFRFAGETGGHSRTKSIQRDNKDSPSQQRQPWAHTAGPPERASENPSFAGTMGTHLTTNENNK